MLFQCTMSALKTFRIKRILSKKGKQNRPIPQWIRCFLLRNVYWPCDVGPCCGVTDNRVIICSYLYVCHCNCDFRNNNVDVTYKCNVLCLDKIVSMHIWWHLNSFGFTFMLLHQDEDWKHDPVQRQEEALEEDQAQALNNPWDSNGLPMPLSLITTLCSFLLNSKLYWPIFDFLNQNSKELILWALFCLLYHQRISVELNQGCCFRLVSRRMILGRARSVASRHPTIKGQRTTSN